MSKDSGVPSETKISSKVKPVSEGNVKEINCELSIKVNTQSVSSES